MATRARQSSRQLAQPMIGELAPAWDLQGADGQRYRLADQRGKLVVVHFGTSW